MIVTLDEVKEYLRIDGREEDDLLLLLISAADTYLYNATGNKFSKDDDLAKLICFVLVSDWYENREYTGTKTTEKVRDIVSSVLAQLTYCSPCESKEAGTKL